MRMLIAIALAVLLAVTLSACASLNAERRAPPIGERVAIDGVEMHVLAQGPRDSAKPPVILIHGASVNLRDMKIALGDRLARERFVVMVDRPGHGYSERPADGHELARQAKLIKGVADSFALERPIVLGQSYGGAVALNYALQYQSEMTGLVLLAPVSHEWPGGVAWYNEVATIPIFGFLFRNFAVPAYAAFVGEKSAEDAFAPETAPPDYFARAGIALLFRPPEFGANAEDLTTLKPQIAEQRRRYGALRLPVAVAHGEADDTVYASIHAKGLDRDIDQASVRLLPGVGHPLHHTQTEVALALIEEVASRAGQ